MSQNTYGDDLGPAAGVYEYVYLIAAPFHVTDTRAPHVIFLYHLSSSSLAERVDGEQQQHACERSSRPGRRVEDAAGVLLLLLARTTVLHDVGAPRPTCCCSPAWPCGRRRGGSPARPLHAVRVIRAPPSSPASRRPRPRRAAQGASSVRCQWRAAVAARRASSATAVDGEQQQQHVGTAAAARRASSAHRAHRP